MNATRRQVIGGLAAGLAELSISAMAPPAVAENIPRRVVALDRLAMQLLLSAGVVPLATDVRDYLTYGAVSPLPSDVVDFGSASEPNLELLQALKPDLLFSSIAPAGVVGRVSEIAPSVFLPVFGQAQSPLSQAICATLRIGKMAESSSVAAASIADLDKAVDIARARLAANSDKSFLLVGLEPDGRHATVYGKNSIMQDVADRIGIRNAWTGPTNAYGFTSISIDNLIGRATSNVLYMDEGPITDAALERLAESPFWANLPFVVEGRLARLSAFDPLGALPTAKAFALSASALLTHSAKGLAG